MSTSRLTMMGFEEAFKTVNGFNFATERDRTSALLLQLWLLKVARNPSAGRMPIVILSGPAGCGKTEFLRRAVAEAGIAPGCLYAKVEPWCFDEAAVQKPQLLSFDLGSSRSELTRALESEELKRWVRAGLWRVRPLGEVSGKEYGVNCVTVLMTQCCGSVLDAADHNFMVIRLRARPEASSSVVADAA